NASCRPASCRDYPAHYGNSCRQTAQASIYPQFKAPDCITSHATYHFTGRYPYLLCFHVSKSCYPHPPPENPVIPDLYLAGIKLANLFRNYLILLSLPQTGFLSEISFLFVRNPSLGSDGIALTCDLIQNVVDEAYQLLLKNNNKT